MTEVVVDTDVISFGFRNDSRFTDYLPHMQGLRPLMSFMTHAEIEFGIRRRNWGQERRQHLEQYLKQYYSVIHSSDALCRVWADLRAESELAGRNLPEADAWNAALAVLLNVPLLSHNRKHYQHVGLHQFDEMDLASLRESADDEKASRLVSLQTAAASIRQKHGFDEPQ